MSIEMLVFTSILTALALLALRLYLLVRDNAKRKRRKARRQRNIAHQRIWDWLYGNRRRAKTLTYIPIDDEQLTR